MKRSKRIKGTADRAGTFFLVLGLAVLAGSVVPGCSGLQRTVKMFVGTQPEGRGPRLGNEKMADFVAGVRSVKGNHESHYRLGIYHQERGRHREALEEFRKSALINPRFLKAYRAMGVSYDFLGDHVRAADSYRQALWFEPKDDATMNNLGYSLYLRGKHAEAIDILREAIALNGKERKYHSNLGRALFATGDHEGALAEFRKAFDEAGAQYYLAHFLYGEGQYRKAQYHYAKALAVNPMFRTAKKGLKAARQMARIEGESTGAEEPKVAAAVPAPAADAQPQKSGRDLSAITRKSEDVAAAVSHAAAPPLEEAPARTTKSEDMQVVSSAKAAPAAAGTADAKPKVAAAVAASAAETLPQNSVLGPTATEQEKEEAAAAVSNTAELPPEKAPVRPLKSADMQMVSSAKAAPAAAVTAEVEPPLKDFVVARCHVQDKVGEKVTVLVYSRPDFMKRNTDVELLNASGESAMSTRLVRYLKSKGYAQVCEADDDEGDCEVTQIVYQEGYLQTAYRVAQQIPGYQNMKKAENPADSGAKVRVVIGRDMIRHKKALSDG